MKFSRFVWATVFLVLLACASVWAGGPVFWEVESRAEVEKGDAKGVSIADNGRITLAPKFDLIYNTKEAYVWSSTTDSAGNIYLGTGHEGRIFKVDSSGQGSMVLDTAELDVTALAVDTHDNIYAGTSPNGKVYKITPDGKSSTFFDPKEKYIWSLAFDQSGTLYVGTGEKGKVYKVAADGQGAIWVKTNETHIMSLALDKSGNVIAGTDPAGLILRIEPSGKTFALFDSPMREIHSLVVAPSGMIYALGISSKAAGDRLGAGLSTSSLTPPTASGDEGSVTVTFSDDTSQSSNDLTLSNAQSSGRNDAIKSVVYQIGAEGQSDIYWSSNNDVAFGLTLDPDNRLLVATGTKGRIFALDGRQHSTLLVQSTEDQTSTLIRTRQGLYATSSNLGKLFRLNSDANTTGTYQSTVRDASTVSQWGNISWRGRGGVQLQTRSGNTGTPDATWSEWSTGYTDSKGTRITSPPARFVQWRASLQRENKGEAPRLDSVMVAYLPRNIAPEVTSITVLPPSVGLQENPQQPIDPGIAAAGLNPTQFGFATNIPPRRVFQKGARSLTWAATDGNTDNLVYMVSYRSIDDNEWHLLRQNLTQNYLTLDVDALPDGIYVFQIVASDSPSNPPGRALTGERITEPVEIDNTPPQIKAGTPSLNGREVTVVFEAVDSASVIKHAEYSLDGAAWRLVFPDDGISDSRAENYTLKLTLNGAGEHTIAFRASDSNTNVGSAKVNIQAPR